MRCETHVSDHMQYKDGHQGAVEWLRLMHDRLHMCSQATGDKHSVTNRVERVKVRRWEVYCFSGIIIKRKFLM